MKWQNHLGYSDSIVLPNIDRSITNKFNDDYNNSHRKIKQMYQRDEKNNTSFVDMILTV